MYFVSGPGHPLYVAPNQSVAEGVVADHPGTRAEHISDEPPIYDFGGILVKKFAYINVELGGATYSFLAHHLTALTQALAEALTIPGDRCYFPAWYYTHVIPRPAAQALLAHLRANWSSYYAQEKDNVAKWTDALQDLDGAPGLSVQSELKPQGMVQ